MASNYRKLGDVIKLVDERNTDGSVTNLLGVSIDKHFMPSVANVIGTDLTKYKVVRKDRFACSLMQVSRDHKMPISRYAADEPSIISPAYVMFDLIGNDVLPEYLELWTQRAEFDREADFYAVGGVRGNMTLDELQGMSLVVPPIEQQHEIVARHNAIDARIEALKRLNDKLVTCAINVFKQLANEAKNEAKLKDFCAFQEGYVNPPQGIPRYFGGSIKWLRGVDFSSDVILDTSRTLTEAGFKSAKKSAYLFRPGTIAITKSGTIGKLGIVQEPMCGNRATINIRTEERRFLPHVYFFLKSIQNSFQDMAVGSAQVNLYASVMEEIDCPQFSDGRFAQFDDFGNRIIDLMTLNQREIAMQEKLRSLLLVALGR